MNNNLIKTLVITSFLISSSLAIAGSNNGYTTAANVYSGSSSRTWYGGGVAFVLSEWKNEKAMPKASPTEPAVEVQEPSVSEGSSSN